MFDSILVVARNSEADRAALARARLCAARETAVTVFEVVYEPALEGYLGNKEIYEPLRSRVVRERREHAEQLAQSLAAAGLTSAGNAAWDHPLEEAVAKEARRTRADLVIAAPLESAGGGLAHSDWRLVSTCPAPVLVVKADAERRYRNVVAAVDPFHAHAKPANLDAKILANAKAIQAMTGAALTVVHCFTHPGTEFVAMPADDLAFGAARREAIERLLAEADIPSSAARVVSGPPHLVLQAMLDTGEADLVVMGALARGRFKELILGNTAERVLHRARGDVLVVKP